MDSGAVVASGQRPHPPTSPPRSEQEPDAWWGAITSLFESFGDAPVQALSVAAQQHGMVVLDAAGQVLRPAKLWNDTESAPDALELRAAIGGAQAWADRTGSVPGAAFTISKLAWLARREPQVHQQVARVLLPHDWLTWRLSGSMVTDRGDASGTGYFSPTTASWDEEILSLVGLGEAAVPRVAAPDEVVGDWRGSTVTPGTGDNMAAAAALALEPGDVVISIGTSGTVYAPSVAPTADPTGQVAGFAGATTGYLPLVCTLNATKVTDAVARLLGVDHTALDVLALEAPPGARGLVLLPYLDGERTPDLPHASGSLHGIRSDITPSLLARAAVEGVVCGLMDGIDALDAAGVSVNAGRLILIGGGARSKAFRQILADVSGRVVTVPDERELVAAGAGVLAAANVTGTEPHAIARAWGLGASTVVDPCRTEGLEVREAYRQARDRSHPTDLRS